MRIARFVSCMFSSAALVCGASAVHAQNYPTKPIRVIAGTPGGGSDILARLMVQGISGRLGQPLIVENRAGIVQTETVAKAPPDGYTVLLQSGSLWILPLLRPTSYDTIMDFSPITLVERSVEVVTVHPSLPVRSVRELIALAKARPGQLNYGASSGGTSLLAAELFKSMAGVNIVHVAFKGTGPALNALLGGEVRMMVASAPTVGPHLGSKKLRGLAVTSAQPSVLAPGLPTVAATGVPGYELAGVTAMMAPAKTPAPVIRLLSEEVIRFLHTQEVRDKFLSLGSEAVGIPPDELAAYIKSDIAKLDKVIKEAGIGTR